MVGGGAGGDGGSPGTGAHGGGGAGSYRTGSTPIWSTSILQQLFQLVLVDHATDTSPIPEHQLAPGGGTNNASAQVVLVGTVVVDASGGMKTGSGDTFPGKWCWWWCLG